MGGGERDVVRGLTDPLADDLLHLAALGEAPEGLLGEDEVAVELDFENAVLTLDQVGVEVEALLQLGRQTGGTGLVVSNNAVFDAEAGHICGLLSGVGSVF